MRPLTHREQLLIGLKRFKRIAKQDLLTSVHTSNSAYWQAQAASRRATYDTLCTKIEHYGVHGACHWAERAHRALCASRRRGDADPKAAGRAQAIELFLTIAGMTMTGVGQRSGRRQAGFTPSDTDRASAPMVR